MHQDFPFLQNLWTDISINSVIQKSSGLYALLHSTQNYSTPLLHLISPVKNAPTKTGWRLKSSNYLKWQNSAVLSTLLHEERQGVGLYDTHSTLSHPCSKERGNGETMSVSWFGLAMCWSGKFRLSLLYKSCVLLTMSFDFALTITETFKWLSLLPILVQK